MRPALEHIRIMDPAPCFFMPGRKLFTVRNLDFRFVATTASHLCSVSSSIDSGFPSPRERDQEINVPKPILDVPSHFFNLIVLHAISDDSDHLSAVGLDACNHVVQGFSVSAIHNHFDFVYGEVSRSFGPNSTG